MKKNLQGLVFFSFLVASVFRKFLQFSESRWSKTVFSLCTLLLSGLSVSAQLCFSNPPDNTGTTIFYTCTGGLSFSLSSTSNNDAPAGPDYGSCSTAGPRSKNAQWLIVKATDNGQIQLTTSLTTGSINIWVWGGFDTMPSDCTKLTNLSICGQYDHNDAITPFNVIKDKYYVILLAGMTGAGPTFTISGTGPANIPKPTVISQSRCGSGPVTLTASGAQTGEKYNWYDSNGILVQSGMNAQFTTPSLSATAQYTVRISVTTNTGTSCESDPTAVTAAINNMPAITAQPVGVSVCQDSDLTLSVTAAGSTDLTYQWRKDGVNIPGATSASYTINNAAGTDAGSYDVTVNNSCGSVNSQPAMVTVNPIPVITVPANVAICPGTVIPATGFTSSLSGTTYSWTNSNTAIGLSAASGVGNIPAFTATNSSAAPISATITVIPALNGCAGTPVTYTITVKALATVNVAPITVCAGTIVPSSNFISNPTGADFSWSNSNTSIGLTDASGIGNVHSFTAINNTSSPVTSTITVIPTVNGCAGTPSTYTITVNPLPVISATTTSTDETACGENDGTITIVASGSLPLEYSIDGGMNFEPNGGNFTGLAAGSYTIAVRNSLGCITVGSTISISSPGAPLQPQINTFTNPICEGSSINISIKDPDASLTYYWTGPYGFTAIGTEITRPNADASMSGNYAITAHNGTCVSPAYVFSVKVNALPVVTVPENITVCSGTLIPATIFTSTPDGASYTWTIDKSEIGLAAAGSSNVQAFTATNNTLIPITATITVIPSLNNCVGMPVSYNITVNPLPTAKITGDYTICYGGSANLSVALTGTAPWTITYSDGSASVTETGIMTSPHTIAVSPASSRTYTITSVSDANSCSNLGSGSATITAPSAPLSATVSKTNITCFGSATGSISYIIGGGTAPYSISYSHNSGALSGPFAVTANSGTITGLAAGSYEVTITDANNCTPIIKTIIITQPAAALAGIATSTHVSCSGRHDGTIIISPSGGYGSYEYSINGGANWQPANSFTGLSAATYNVMIRDAAQHTCIFPVNTTLTIDEPESALSATATSTDISCFGKTDGTITIHATGGYGTYQYSIDGGASWQAENIFTGLSATSYNVQVRDATATSCVTVINAPLTIAQPAAAVAGTAISTDVTCFGEANGTITITATGGYGTYEYSINGGTSWQAGKTFTGLRPDSYHVLVRDRTQTSCVATVDPFLTIVQPVSAVTGTAVATNVTCMGAGNGTITITASGGYGTYEYTVDGGKNWQADNLFSGLVPGNYNVQVRDAAQTSCTTIINVSLPVIQPAEAVSGIAVATNITCIGADNGTITITASGGYGNYEYSINGGTSWQTTHAFTGLPPGVYNVQVRDAGQTACTAVVNNSMTIAEPAALTLDGSFTPIKCYGGSTNVTLIAGGGTGVLEYRSGTGSFQSSNLFTGVTSGNHQFMVRDINGCEQGYTVTIPEPDELKLTASTSPVQCDGTSMIILTAEGGTRNYQFKNGTGNYQASNTFNLGQGSYTFYVTDGACEASAIVNIAGLSTLNLTGSFTPIACPGGNSTVTLVANGGNGNYTYKRDNGSWQSSAAFTVTSGNHIFAVRDAGGCQQFYQLNIPEPEKLNVVLTKLKDASCFGTSTGSLDLKITGQKGTTDIVWFKNGLAIATPVNLNGLPAGKYSVQVTDMCSSITSTEIIIEPSPLTVVLRKIKDADCSGTATGALELLISGGEGIVTQKWTRNGITIPTPSNLSALPAGTYKVTVYDNCNTVESGTVIIDPASLQADFYKIIDVRCKGGADGGIGLRVFNSAGATTVSWFKNDAAISTPADSRQLSAGTYYVQVADLCSRIITEKITISEPEPLITSLTVKNTVCKTSNDGIITAITTGGTQPYSYHWKELAQTTSVVNNLAPGVYEILITDANGCSFKTSAEVMAGTCPPVAADDRFTTDEEVALSGSVAANDFDRQKENLTFAMTSAVKNGRIVFTDDGSFTYTPNPGFWETETFTYRICNTSGLCADATATISVVPYTVVSLTPAILDVKEGKKAVLTAKLMRPFKDDVVITISYTGGAGKDKDYMLLDQFQNIRIPKGQVTTTQKITIAALTDDLEEGDESIILQISGTSDPLVRTGTGSVVIISDIHDPFPGTPVSTGIPANPDITPDPLLSPNGDGQGNEFFKIENIVSFPDNEVIIFNRWGNEVFRIKGYNESDRVFSGMANTGLVTNANSPLPDGIYYYLITTKRTAGNQNIPGLNKGYLILKH